MKAFPKCFFFFRLTQLVVANAIRLKISNTNTNTHHHHAFRFSTHVIFCPRFLCNTTKSVGYRMKAIGQQPANATLQIHKFPQVRLSQSYFYPSPLPSERIFGLRLNVTSIQHICNFEAFWLSKFVVQVLSRITLPSESCAKPFFAKQDTKV